MLRSKSIIRQPVRYPTLSCNLSTKAHRPSTQTRLIYAGIGFSALSIAAAYLFLPDPSRSAPTLASAPLSPTHFTPATVISNKSSGPDTKLLTLAIPPKLIPYENSSIFRPIWSVFIKDDDIQVERPYTPLSGVDKNGHMLFWIKKYPKGEVGRWLHSKSPGDTIELRGPLKTWEWQEDAWDDIVMISGGTGITPFIQLFNERISNETDSSTRFTLLHSSHTPEDLPPPPMLDPLVSFARLNPDRFRMEVFVDSNDASSSPLPTLNIGRIGAHAIEKCLGMHTSSEGAWWSRLFSAQRNSSPLPRRTLFLICGPEPMVSAIAGPYGRNFSQGPVGGILGQLSFTSKQVWKL